MSPLPQSWIVPDWPVPRRVRALITTRPGGVSAGPFGVPPDGRGGMNLGFRSDDDPASVRENRAILRRFLPAEPRWLKQVHGSTVVEADGIQGPVEADASITASPGVVAAVMIADCMPVLLADPAGRCVGVAHAGWRGLAGGVIQATARQMRSRLGDAAADLVAYLGPAIGPGHFEVGPEVLEAMARALPDARTGFAPTGGKYLADLFALGRQALGQVGVTRIHGGDVCTYSDPANFYSYRRDRVTGRHAALVWIEPTAPDGEADEGQAGRNGV